MGYPGNREILFLTKLAHPMQGFNLAQFLLKRIPSGEPLQGGVAAGGLGMKIEEGTPHATAEGVEPVRSGHGQRAGGNG